MPSVTYVLLPGQGTDLGAVAMQPLRNGDLARTAHSVLGVDVTRLTPSQLAKTEFSQLVLTVRCLDAVLSLRKQRPELFGPRRAVVFAGFSLGEITALVAAGKLEVADALKIVRMRAKAMQKACDEDPGAMVTLIGAKDESLIPPELCVASRLFPGCRVVAGPSAAVNRVQWTPAIAEKVIKRDDLAGAFHTESMRPAATAILSLHGEVHQDQGYGNCFVYSNTTGELYGDDDDVIEMLASQVVNTVEWEKILGQILNDPRADTIIEIGATGQHRAMLKRFPNKNEQGEKLVQDLALVL